MSLQPTAFRKHGNKRRNCSKQAISPLVYSIIILSFKGSFPFFQSCLLQICCMWENVKGQHDMIFLELFALMTSEKEIEISSKMKA